MKKLVTKKHHENLFINYQRSCLFSEKKLKILTSLILSKKKITVINSMFLWKILYLWFWFADSIHSQISFANDLSSLVLKCSKKASLTYFGSFFSIINQKWFTIDKLRLDKFMMLVRKFMISMFVVFSREHWTPEIISPYMKYLTDLLLAHTLTSNILPNSGLIYHLCDIFIVELINICNRNNEQLPKKALLNMLQPFIQFLLEAKKSENSRISRYKNSILLEIANSLLKPNGKLLKEIKPFSIRQIIYTHFNTVTNDKISELTRSILSDCHFILKQTLKNVKKNYRKFLQIN